MYDKEGADTSCMSDMSLAAALGPYWVMMSYNVLHELRNISYLSWDTTSQFSDLSIKPHGTWKFQRLHRLTFELPSIAQCCYIS
eukprot:s830_g17.t1